MLLISISPSLIKKNNFMDRKQFLKSLGLGAAALVVINEIQSCKKDNPKIDFTVDMSTSQYSALLNVGGSAITQQIIIAHTPSGYVAVSDVCTHQGCGVNYDSSGNQFACPCHGARFNTTGGVVNGPATSPLTKYTVTQSGNTLHITS